MVESNQSLCRQDDEVDLRELWATILKRKSVLIITVFVFTLASIIYVSILKPVKPLYEANALIEIGKGINKSFQNPVTLDTAYDLKNIVERLFKINVDVPRNAGSLILLSSSNLNKEIAEKTVQVGIDFILKRHQYMKDDFQAIRMSSLVGDVEVKNIAKQPKKKLIVAVSFISSLIFSLFLIFFLEFIQAGRKEEIEEV